MKTTITYHLAPAHDATNVHATGYGGNHFSTAEDAFDAIPGVQAEGPGDAHEWVVVAVKYALVSL